MKKTLFCYRMSNPGCQFDRSTLDWVTIKALLYRKAVQVYHIPIPGDILPSNLKFVPEFLGVRESHEMRLKEFYAHVGYLQLAPNVIGEKILMPRLGIKPGLLDSKSYTLLRRYKNRLVPQGSRNVSYTYTR